MEKDTEQVVCTRCGKVIDTTLDTYAIQGKLLCRACFEIELPKARS